VPYRSKQICGDSFEEIEDEMFDELYFLTRDNCGGPYKEVQDEKGN
jgi:hypothetical protein